MQISDHLSDDEKREIKRIIDEFFKSKGFTKEFLDDIKRKGDQSKGEGQLNIVIKN